MIATRIPKVARSAWHSGAMKLHREGTFGEVSKNGIQWQTQAVQTFFKIGTPLAINKLTDGVAVHSTNSTAKGGVRNRADRESYSLTAAHIANLIAAKHHAVTIGLPFTRMITIHWEAAGLPLDYMAKATGHFLDLLTKTLARHDEKTTWLFVHENAPGSGYDKGGHVHLLAYVPTDLIPVIKKLQLRWLRQITGQPYRARVILSKPIGGRLGLEKSNPDAHAINLEAAFGYLLKGADPTVASQFGLNRIKAGGRVIGKRCGTSQNIGIKARSVWLNAD